MHARSAKLAVLAATGVAAAAFLPTPAYAGAPKPGSTGPTITLDSGINSAGYDMATDAGGTTYIGWLASHYNTADSTRYLFECTLPQGATGCAGGIKQIAAGTDALEASTAGTLHVAALAGGGAEFVWFKNAEPDAENGPRGGRIMGWNSNTGGAPVVLSDSFSNGELLDAGIDPSGRLWTVDYAGVPNSAVEVRHSTDATFAAFVPVSTTDTGFAGIGYAELAFQNGTTALEVQKYGTVSTAPKVAVSTDGATFGGFSDVPHTWTAAANASMVGTSTGIRLVTSTDSASYYPVVSNLKGTSMQKPTLTGDKNNCAPSSHDLVTDASGRIADVSIECEQLAVVNMPDTQHSAITRINVPDTFAGGTPQIAGAGSGKAWVLYSVETANVTGDVLKIVPVLLPDLSVSKSGSNKGGKVTVTGPMSCLPPIGAPTTMSVKPAKKWHVVSKSLTMSGHKQGGTVDGSHLTAAKSFTLIGTAKFSNGSQTKTEQVKLTFKSCPKP